jgi:hypothetical protein
MTMGANKTYQQMGDRGRMLGESDEFRRLRHAVEKAAGDRERAIRIVCRLYTGNHSTRCLARSGRRYWRCSTRSYRGAAAAQATPEP